MSKRNIIRKVIHWTLLGVALIFLLSGFGITEFRLIEKITFGLLTKPSAFKIHSGLWIPFVILLIIHIWYYPITNFILKIFRKRKDGAAAK